MILPDGNLLIAFSWAEHAEHEKARRFFSRHPKVVTCPITELNLLRVIMQLGATGEEADRQLKNFVTRRRSRLIPADISAVAISGLNVGHRQTTDSYLALLARKYQMKVATLDRNFSERFPDLVELVN